MARRMMKLKDTATSSSTVSGLVPNRAERVVAAIPQGRVLVVEDEPEVCAIIESQISGAGYEVVTASTGREALSRLDEHTPAVALVDLMLPDMNGIELIEQMRERRPDLSAIIFTGNPTMDSAVAAIRHGVFGYLTKPHTRAQLLQMLSSAFQTRRLAEENLRLAAVEVESRRLTALVQASQSVSGSVLDDTALQRIVRVVAQALEADACTLRVLNESRRNLVLRASHGLSAPFDLDRRVVSVDDCIDGYTVQAKKTRIVDDMETDHRLPEQSLLLAHGLKSLLCVPVLKDGVPIGSLVVYWKDKRSASSADKRAMYVLANQVTFTVGNRDLYRRVSAVHEKLQAHHEKMIHELDLAFQVQKAMLPGDCTETFGQVATCLLAVEPLAGDFFNYLRVNGTQLSFYIGDVTGRGVVSAITMLFMHSTLAQHCKAGLPPARILQLTNEELCKVAREELREAALTTAFCGSLSLRDGTFRYAKAAHDGLLWWSGAANEGIFLDADGHHLGLFEQAEYEEHEVCLVKDDLLIFYTDGITEAINESGERFGRKRVRDLIAANRSRAAADIRAIVVESLRDFTGQRAALDDQAFMVFKFFGVCA